MRGARRRELRTHASSGGAARKDYVPELALRQASAWGKPENPM